MRSSALIALAAFVVVIAGIKSAQVIMVPFLLAVFIAIISAPLLLWLEGHGLPRILAFLLVIAGVVGILTGVGTIVGASMNGFLDSLPEIQRKLGTVALDGMDWLKKLEFQWIWSICPKDLTQLKQSQQQVLFCAL